MSDPVFKPNDTAGQQFQAQLMMMEGATGFKVARIDGEVIAVMIQDVVELGTSDQVRFVSRELAKLADDMDSGNVPV